jgi:hypothetical protein
MFRHELEMLNLSRELLQLSAHLRSHILLSEDVHWSNHPSDFALASITSTATPHNLACVLKGHTTYTSTSHIITAFVVARNVFHQHDGRSWYRAAGIAASRYLLRERTWTIWELRSVLGATTAEAYAAWARKDRAEALTDELPEGAKLHWIGPRREDRVILYFHGVYSFFSYFAVC